MPMETASTMGHTRGHQDPYQQSGLPKEGKGGGGVGSVYAHGIYFADMQRSTF